MSTLKERDEVTERLSKLGITYEDAQTLRRIARTLQRWFELECGDSNDYMSWAIERDESTDKPYMVRYPYTGTSYRTPIPDRENGARKRLAKLMEKYPALIPYIQTDPRGASVYILTVEDVQGVDLDRVYTRGVALY